MMRSARMLVSAALLWACVAAGAFGAESLVTVRVGEQDTCAITGVTAVTPGGAGAASIKFDLAKLPKGARATKALLRLWANAGGPKNPFSIDRWNEADFDGLKVWQVGGKDDPVAVVYPFAFTPVACHEWDITPAVAAWLADPAANQGLKTNFPLPAANVEPAWQRPYLEITLVGPNPNRPKQPADLNALYRSGQVFLTWKQIPHDGAFFDSTYRVYTHTEPITAANLADAGLLGEVHRLSQLDYRRTMYNRTALGSYAAYLQMRAYFDVKRPPEMTTEQYNQALLDNIPKHYNFVIDDTWGAKLEGGKWLTDPEALGKGYRMEKGPELSDDTGLFVHTVKKAGKAFFAVTSVLEGNENREDFAAANALAQPVETKVETPKPVLQVVFHRIDTGYPNQRYQYREYVHWGGADGLHNEPSTPFYFRLTVPSGYFNAKARGAEWIEIATRLGGTVGVDGVYVPLTRLAPFPPTSVSFSTGNGAQTLFEKYYGAKKYAEGQRYGRSDALGNFYGYHDRVNTGLDPRQATVQPYIERRALFALEHLFNEFPFASRDHVVTGSEGQALMIGLHHPGVFAHITTAQERLWTSNTQQGQWLAVGKREWKLLNDQKENAWDWNDPVWYSKKFPTLTWPFISSCQSPNYDGSGKHWNDSGYPGFYLAMMADKRGGQWWWCDIGDAPNGGSMSTPRNQAYLAFTNCNFGEVPPAEDWRKEPRGSPNAYLTWHHPEVPFKLPPAAKKGEKAPEPAVPLDLVDTAARFEIAIRIGDRGLSLNGQSVPATNARFGLTDITPWRLQQFKIEKGAKYIWTNRKVMSGQLLQAGTVEPDERGFITIPAFMVDRDPAGNKLAIEPAAGKAAPKVDEQIKIAVPPAPGKTEGQELAYADYVKQCQVPVMRPTVKPPVTKFTIAEFTTLQGRSASPDGSVSFRGGSFGSGWDTEVDILEAGDYVLTMRAKAKYGAAWPLLDLAVGKGNIKLLGRKIVDTNDWMTYYWYAKLETGKLNVRAGVPNEYYIAGVLPGLKDQTLQVADLTFTKLADAAKTPVELAVSPRAIDVPAGLPVRFTGKVLNGLGQPLESKVSWSAEGGKIDPDGVLTAAQPGPCTVTAKSADDLSITVPITAADAFLDNFNEGNAAVRSCWATADLGEKPGRWSPPPGGHAMLSSLIQNERAAKTLFLWEPGLPMTDCSVSADVIMMADRNGDVGLGKGAKIVRGLVIRAKDKDNHYRLEVERRDNGSEVRLVKRLAGAESVIAKTDTPPELAPFDYKTNPAFPGLHNSTDVRAAETHLVDSKLDRLVLSAKGDSIQAWVNGKEVFPNGVKDSDLKTGAPGLYSEGTNAFDTVEVRAAK